MELVYFSILLSLVYPFSKLRINPVSSSIKSAFSKLDSHLIRRLLEGNPTELV